MHRFRPLLYSGMVRLCFYYTHIIDWGVVSTHYNGVILGAMAYQITSLTIIYSTVYSGADQRKHPSSASLDHLKRTGTETINTTKQNYNKPCLCFMVCTENTFVCGNMFHDTVHLLSKCFRRNPKSIRIQIILVATGSLALHESQWAFVYPCQL